MSVPAPIPVDHAVREEIRTAVGSNLMVEAGAGTGKTSSLVDRIVEILRSGHADVDGLGAITFTNKAATELSARVREKLEEAIDGESDPEVRERLAEAARGLYRARIETIHSFATDILRERPVEAGLDPEFRALTDLESQLLFDEVFGEWLGQVLAGELPQIAHALNLGAEPWVLRQIAELINEHRYLLPLAKFEAVEADGSELTDWLAANLAELRGIAERCNDPEDGALGQINLVLDFATRLEIEGTTPAARARLIATAAPAIKRNKGSQRSWDDAADCRRWKNELGAEFQELAGRVPAEMRAAALTGVIPLVEGFVRDFEARRRREARPDFTDLIVWARDLVRDRPEVRRYFQNRFAALLIDEFQDTDPAQVELATYLATDSSAEAGWRELAPAPGKLFVVGDPKQSIYRFRRADIGIYDEVKAGPLATGYREIVQNFRSVSGILDWVNRTFDALFEEQQGLQPGNVQLRATHAPASDRPSVAVIRGAYPELGAEALREAESEAVAALLHGAVEGDDPWLVRDPVTNAARPAQWRDVGILLPTRTGVEAFESALAAVGIPFRHEGSRDYFQREEVRDLVLILRAIDDPRDQISLIGALRSAAFGCSDDDLAVHAGTSESAGNPWDYRFDQQSQSARVLEAFGILRGLHRARERLSLPLLVQRVLTESHLVEAALLRPDGPQGAANLLAIVDQARSFSAAGGGGPRPFIRWLVENTERESQEVDAGIAEETDDVVRIMTMHGAKGLEFPVTVLANLGGRGRDDRGPVSDEAERRLHFSVGARGRRLETPGYDDRWAEEKAALALEQIRLLYVAATRARDFLVIPDLSAGDPGPLLAALKPHLPTSDGHEVIADGLLVLDAAQISRPAPVQRRRRQVPEAEAAAGVTAREAWADSHASLIAASRQGIGLTVASSVKRSIRPLASEASHSEMAMLVSEGPPLEIGDALHKLMEVVTLPGAEDLEPLAESICTEFGIADHAGDLIEMARRCLASKNVAAAIASGEYQREVPFTLAGEDGFTVGRVDLVFRDPDGTLVIVDYKSDEVEAVNVRAHTDEHYAGQAETYADSLEALTGAAAARVVFVYARSGTEVELKR